MAGTQLVHKFKAISAYVGTPSSAAPVIVSLKNYGHLTIFLSVENATTVTGSAVTLSQSTDVAGTGAKALAFTKAWRCLDTTASDTLAEFTVSSNTFTTLSTNSKRALYVIEVEASSLDVDNDFDCIKVGLGNATATTISALYVLSECREAGNVSILPSAIVD